MHKSGVSKTHPRIGRAVEDSPADSGGHTDESRGPVQAFQGAGGFLYPGRERGGLGGRPAAAVGLQGERKPGQPGRVGGQTESSTGTTYSRL